MILTNVMYSGFQRFPLWCGADYITQREHMQVLQINSLLINIPKCFKLPGKKKYLYKRTSSIESTDWMFSQMTNLLQNRIMFTLRHWVVQASWANNRKVLGSSPNNKPMWWSIWGGAWLYPLLIVCWLCTMNPRNYLRRRRNPCHYKETAGNLGIVSSGWTPLLQWHWPLLPGLRALCT